MHLLIGALLLIGIIQLIRAFKLWKWVLMPIILIVTSGVLHHMMDETHEVPDTMSFYFGAMILVWFVSNWCLNKVICTERD